MRYVLLLFLFSCAYINATSQKKKTRFDLESFDALKFKPFEVEIETKGKPSIQTHFNTVVIHDFRADKSKLGLPAPVRKWRIVVLYFLTKIKTT